MAWALGVDGRAAEGLQSPHRARKALCGSCDARDGERIRSRGLRNGILMQPDRDLPEGLDSETLRQLRQLGVPCRESIPSPPYPCPRQRGRSCRRGSSP